MNANDNLERRIADFYESEAPSRAPDWVLRSTLDTVNDTQQRRVIIRAPWRFPQMNSFAKLAIAAVIVIAVGAVGWRMLGPSSPSGVGGQPTPSPSPSPPATPSPDPSAPPPLGGTFTSSLHGITLSYPTGWSTAPATEPWTTGTELDFYSPASDHIYDPVLQDHLFLAVASQPLGGKTGDTWVTDYLGRLDQGCGANPTEPITVGGASGRGCDGLVAFSIQDRGYFIRLYTSGDEPWLANYYDQAWFRTVLDTVQLHPENAVDTVPSPST